MQPVGSRILGFGIPSAKKLSEENIKGFRVLGAFEIRSCAFEGLAESLLAAVRGDGDGQLSTIRHLLRDT